MPQQAQQPAHTMRERRSTPGEFVWREMWAALAITAMWVAVIFAAVFGPDIVSNNAPTSVTTIPSGVAVAAFASLATWVVAKYGFGPRGRGDR